MMFLGLAPGCMNQQLRYSAGRTTRSLPDLQYQQVVDNLARIASNPGYLPYLAVAGQGSVQVTDGGNSSLGLEISSGILSSGLLSVGASRSVTGTWNMGTITSPEKLRAMQVIYQNAVRGAALGEPAFGWLHVGSRHDLPRQACYVGRQGGVYAWVMPEGIGGLSDLTLAIIDIATREDLAAPLAPGERPRGAALMAVPRRNFQVPPVGPVFTPGAR
jgi:hypothetical protein